MPSALAPHPQVNNAPSQLPGLQTDSAHADESLGQLANASSQLQPACHANDHAHAHDHAHDHALPHNHGLRLSGLVAEISPVLASVWARVLTTLAMLGLLWLAIFWAFAGNV
jgi:hypothetical protein